MSSLLQNFILFFIFKIFGGPFQLEFIFLFTIYFLTSFLTNFFLFFILVIMCLLMLLLMCYYFLFFLVNLDFNFKEGFLPIFEDFSLNFIFCSSEKESQSDSHYKKASSSNSSTLTFSTFCDKISLSNFLVSNKFLVLYNSVSVSLESDLNKKISFDFLLYSSFCKSTMKIFKLDPSKEEDCFLLEFIWFYFVVKESGEGLYVIHNILFFSNIEFKSFFNTKAFLQNSLIKEVDLSLEDISKGSMSAADETLEQYNESGASVAKYINDFDNEYSCSFFNCGSSSKYSPSFKMASDFSLKFIKLYESNMVKNSVDMSKCQDFYMDYICFISLFTNIFILFSEFLFSYNNELKSSKFSATTINSTFIFILSSELEVGLGSIFLNEVFYKECSDYCSSYCCAFKFPKLSPHYFLDSKNSYESFNLCVWSHNKKMMSEGYPGESLVMVSSSPPIFFSSKYSLVSSVSILEKGEMSTLCFFSYKLENIYYFIKDSSGVIWHKNSFFFMFSSTWSFQFCFTLYPLLFFDMSSVGGKKSKDMVVKNFSDYKSFTFSFISFEYFFLDSSLLSMVSFFNTYGHLLKFKKGSVKNLEIPTSGLKIVKDWSMKDSILKKK